MATVYTDSFTGGTSLTVKGGKSAASLATILRDMITDMGVLRTAIVAVTAKLDAENVTNLDTDYGATCNPVALISIKG